jgi:isocitrate lyase
VTCCSLSLIGDIKLKDNLVESLSRSFPSSSIYHALSGIRESVKGNTSSNIQKSQEAIFRAIADARLGLFGKASGSIGVELPLTTLPDFHYQCFAAHRLAMGLVNHSMQAYVQQVQRPERAHYEMNKGKRLLFSCYSSHLTVASFRLCSLFTVYSWLLSIPLFFDFADSLPFHRYYHTISIL